MELSDYKGDEIYSIPATGDCVVGDEVAFDRATFTGSYKKPIQLFNHNRPIGRFFYGVMMTRLMLLIKSWQSLIMT